MADPGYRAGQSDPGDGSDESDGGEVRSPNLTGRGVSARQPGGPNSFRLVDQLTKCSVNGCVRAAWSQSGLSTYR